MGRSVSVQMYVDHRCKVPKIPAQCPIPVTSLLMTLSRVRPTYLVSDRFLAITMPDTSSSNVRGAALSRSMPSQYKDCTRAIGPADGSATALKDLGSTVRGGLVLRTPASYQQRGRWGKREMGGGAEG